MASVLCIKSPQDIIKRRRDARNFQSALTKQLALVMKKKTDLKRFCYEQNIYYAAMPLAQQIMHIATVLTERKFKEEDPEQYDQMYGRSFEDVLHDADEKAKYVKAKQFQSSGFVAQDASKRPAMDEDDNSYEKKIKIKSVVTNREKTFYDIHGNQLQSKRPAQPYNNNNKDVDTRGGDEKQSSFQEGGKIAKTSRKHMLRAKRFEKTNNSANNVVQENLEHSQNLEQIKRGNGEYITGTNSSNNNVSESRGRGNRRGGPQASRGRGTRGLSNFESQHHRATTGGGRKGQSFGHSSSFQHGERLHSASNKRGGGSSWGRESQSVHDMNSSMMEHDEDKSQESDVSDQEMAHMRQSVYIKKH